MDLISLIQALTKKYIHNAEDAGCNMYNIYLHDDLGRIVQVYIDDAFHEVWITHYAYGCETTKYLNTFTEKEQVEIFEKFFQAITK